jgi:hypothetical protein
MAPPPKDDAIDDRLSRDLGLSQGLSRVTGSAISGDAEGRLAVEKRWKTLWIGCIGLEYILFGTNTRY